MKKIILLIILMIPTIVFASEKQIKDYQIIKEYGPYQENPSKEYPYLSDEFILKEERMLKEKPFSKENREIYEEVYYKGYEEAYIRRMAITNIISYNGKPFPLTEIEIYNNNEKISFEVNCNTCTNEEKGFNDFNKDEIISNFNSISIIEILLDKPYKKEDLKVILYFQKDVNKDFYYALSWTENTTKAFPMIGYSPELLYVRFLERVQANDIITKEATYNKENLINVYYEKEPVYLKEIKDKKIKLEEVITYYGYKEKWYKSYRLIEIPIYSSKENKNTLDYNWNIKTIKEIPKQKENSNKITSKPKNINLEIKIENSKIMFYKKIKNKPKISKFRHYLILIMLIVLGILFFLSKLIKRRR